MATNVFGAGTAVPDAAQSQLWSWITGGTLHAAAANVARARALLAAAGWRDTDGDGILDKGGIPFRVSVIYASNGAARPKFAVQSQAMWKTIGVSAELHPAPGQDWNARRQKGDFDIDITGSNQDASPSSLVEAWSCASAQRAGSLNVAHWCDPTFDRLVSTATTSRGGVGTWRAVLDRMASQHPAAFLASPSTIAAVHGRFDNVLIMPVRQWLYLWQWRIRPGAAIARDR
jgi:peptide/nickel transport system substrate-binding protein